MVRKFFFLILAVIIISSGTTSFAADHSIRLPRTPRQPEMPGQPEFPPIKKAEFIHFPRKEEELHRPRAPRRSARVPRVTAPTPTPTANPTTQPAPTQAPAPAVSPTPLPTTPESSCPNPSTCNEFGITGLRWSDPNGANDQGIPYYINTTSIAGLSVEQVQTVLDNSFGVWEQANTSGRLRYRYTGATRSAAGTQDFQNTVSFLDFNRVSRYRGALAVTSMWYRADTKEIIEFDITFNSSVAWSINALPVGCSEYPIDTCIGDLSSYDFQSVAVHEIGHTFMLVDLRKFSQRELTMYGSAKRGELKKRTLGLGDITGVNLLYP